MYMYIVVAALHGCCNYYVGSMVISVLYAGSSGDLFTIMLEVW